MTDLKVGDAVVIHNYEVGKFLESHNGTVGIFVFERGKDCFVKFGREDWNALGYPRECLLPLRGDVFTADVGLIERLRYVIDELDRRIRFPDPKGTS